MTVFNGLVAIDSYLAPFVASTSLSSRRAVLIHQFDDGHGVVQTSAAELVIASTAEASIARAADPDDRLRAVGWGGSPVAQ
jgi:hypothetical protein